MTVDALKKRAGFGEEKYEMPEFQQKVGNIYEKIYDPKYWTKIDGGMSLEDIHKEVVNVIKNYKFESKPLDILF